MKNLLRPNLILSRFDQFDISGFRKKGYDTILLDVDNTITPYTDKVPNSEGKAFVEELKKVGFTVIVFSNNTSKRIKPIAEAINCEYVCCALKPLPFRYKKTIHKYHRDIDKTICLGDQLFTDVLGANLSGVYSIYSKRLSEKDSFYAAIMRVFERFTFKHILHEEV